MPKYVEKQARKRGQPSDGLYVATIDTGERNPNGSKKYKYIRAKPQKELKVKVDAYKLDITLHGKPLQKDTGRVFDTNVSTVNHMHDRICAAAEINPKTITRNKKSIITYGIGIHALRHTLATRLIENNVNIKYVSEILGHQDITTTYNIYSHVLEDTKKEVADLINNVFNE